MQKKIRKFFKPKKLTSLRTEKKSLTVNQKSLAKEKVFCSTITVIPFEGVSKWRGG